MKKKTTALLTLVLIAVSCVLIAVSCPAMARTHHANRDDASREHPPISCETVRAYVAQAGLEQAKAMAQAAGMTASEERKAMQCLERKI
jgi:uncharacterized protein YneF (UPF0154 family)